MGKKREWSSFRNNVIHNGHFPTKEEAIKAINVTLKYIHEVLYYFAKDDEISGEEPNDLTLYKYYKTKTTMKDLIEKYEKEYKIAFDIDKVAKSTIYLTTVIRFMHNFNNISHYHPSFEFKQIKHLEVYTYDEQEIEYAIDQFIKINKSGYKK